MNELDLSVLGPFRLYAQQLVVERAPFQAIINRSQPLGPLGMPPSRVML
jgi:hypothetical protein